MAKRVLVLISADLQQAEKIGYSLNKIFEGTPVNIHVLITEPSEEKPSWTGILLTPKKMETRVIHANFLFNLYDDIEYVSEKDSEHFILQISNKSGEIKKVVKKFGADYPADIEALRKTILPPGYFEAMGVFIQKVDLYREYIRVDGNAPKLLANVVGFFVLPPLFILGAYLAFGKIWLEIGAIILLYTLLSIIWSFSSFLLKHETILH